MLVDACVVAAGGLAGLKLRHLSTRKWRDHRVLGSLNRGRTVLEAQIIDIEAYMYIVYL